MSCFCAVGDLIFWAVGVSFFQSTVAVVTGRIAKIIAILTGYAAMSP